MRRHSVLLGCLAILVVTFSCAEFSASGADDAAIPDASPSGEPQPVGAVDARIEDGSGGDAGGPSDTGAPVGCLGAPACERVVFVTSMSYPATLGGLAGADEKCNVLAAKSPLGRVHGRQFAAWLSLSAEESASGKDTPVGRLPHGTAPYVRVDGAVIATSFDALVAEDGGALLPIHHDERGNMLPIVSTTPVWTATSRYGVAFGKTCGGWMSSTGPSGQTGDATKTGGQWTANDTLTCSSTARLYCFEL